MDKEKPLGEEIRVKLICLYQIVGIITAKYTDGDHNLQALELKCWRVIILQPDQFYLGKECHSKLFHVPDSILQ